MRVDTKSDTKYDVYICTLNGSENLLPHGLRGRHVPLRRSTRLLMLHAACQNGM
jgi:hypothetical protein